MSSKTHLIQEPHCSGSQILRNLYKSRAWSLGPGFIEILSFKSICSPPVKKLRPNIKTKQVNMEEKIYSASNSTTKIATMDFLLVFLQVPSAALRNIIFFLFLRVK